MTQQPDSTPMFQRFFRLCSLLQGLGWLGGISLLSGGVVFAQTSPTADTPAVPSAQDLLMNPAQSAPTEPSLAMPTPSAPETMATPPSRLTSVEPTRPAPAAVVESSPAPDSSAASVPAPDVIIESIRGAVTPAPTDMATDTTGESHPSSPQGFAQNSEPQNNESLGSAAQTHEPPNSYIDTTDYSLGATPGYSQPGSVVLSERSTGCQAVVREGQNIPVSICAPNGSASKPGRDGSVASLSSVNIGPLQLSANGVGIGQSFYNLTQRPMGLPGNGNIRLMFPLSIPTAITSAFGWRIHPITGALRFHYGTDLGAPMGTPVLAAYAGRVSIADFMQGYGLTVVMHHSNNSAETLYGHLSEIFVQPGDEVTQGQVIGRVGSTGNSTGPHLHFEFRERTSEGWVALNPGNMLQQAIARFSRDFQLAQFPSNGLIAFGLDGFDEVLKALQADPSSLQFKQIQFGDRPVALEFDPDEIKDWSKIKEKATVSLRHED